MFVPRIRNALIGVNYMRERDERERERERDCVSKYVRMYVIYDVCKCVCVCVCVRERERERVSE
jgi:hypothetical protein